MKSICIKTNDTHLLNYLLNEFDYIEIDKVCISTNQFKNYKNIIIHYTGNEISAFIHEVSCILSCFVIDEIEESILKRLILKNYFYFEAIERREILDICYDIFTDEFNEYLFDYTSKISIEDIKQAKNKDKKKKEEKRIMSPYTLEYKRKTIKLNVLIIVIAILLVLTLIIMFIVL